MESLAKYPLLKFLPNTLQVVRAANNLDKPGEMGEAIDLLGEWVKMQKHLIKKDFPRDYLERAIISTKGSVERAKYRIDKACTLRTLMPSMFGDYDVKNDFKHIYNVMNHAVLPQMTADYYRIYILNNIGDNIQNTDTNHYLKVLFPMMEYVRSHDYAKGMITILDYRNANLMELTTKINFSEMHEGVNMITEGYGARLKEVHIISSSKLIDIIVSFLKQILKPKLASRVIVHQTIETMLEYIVPRQILPREYGGEERSLKDLNDEWIETLRSPDFREHYKSINEAKTNESLRETGTFNDLYMGMPGTFRKMNVD